MKTAVIAYTKKALQTACRVAGCLKETETMVYTIPRLLTDTQINKNAEFPEPAERETLPALSQEMIGSIPADNDTFYLKLFCESDLLVFVSALGIAVRKIAPYVKDKREDPAVLCIDEKGKYVISVLSGHIGGANEAARQIAEKLGAQAVITTATDVNHRFSVDAWAVSQGLIIDDMQAAKAVSAAILEQDIPMLCESPVRLSGLKQNDRADTYSDTGLSGSSFASGIIVMQDNHEACHSSVGIYVGWKVMNPFPVTLRLIPRVLHLGIGCRRGVSKEQIERAVLEVFAQNRMDIRAVRGIYTIDLKKDEGGLLEFCGLHGWSLTAYSAEELMAVPGDFSSSGFVQSITGVDNVCERAAMKEADTLLIRKTAVDGVTVAAAVKALELKLDLST